MTDRNPYQILGVDPKAAPEDIKKAYRKLANTHHPDKEGGDHDRMQDIQWAYDILSDPERRERWDLGQGDGQPAPIEAEALHAIAQFFNEWIDQIAMNDAYAAHSANRDPLMHLANRFNNRMAEIQNDTRKFRAKLKKVEKLLGKFSTKGEQVNVFQNRLKEIQKQMQSSIASAERAVEVGTSAIKILDEFTFDGSELVPAAPSSTFDIMYHQS